VESRNPVRQPRPLPNLCQKASPPLLGKWSCGFSPLFLKIGLTKPGFSRQSTLRSAGTEDGSVVKIVLVSTVVFEHKIFITNNILIRFFLISMA
jgi:hypothetical protein